MEYDINNLLKQIAELEAELKTAKKYGLVWDKERIKEDVVVQCETNIPVIKPETKKRLIYGDDNNVIIEGDNFHSLICLNYVLKESFDVIYIDPPYFTGNNDFRYNDNFVSLDDGFRHSKWLNSMSKRLYLAHELLKREGLIFISIDENELFNLKLLCDQVFCEKNFRSLITVVANPGGRDYGGIAKTTEYVLVYGKSIDSVIEKVPSEDHVFIYSDELGPFELRELRNRNTKFNDKNRPNLCYPFYVDPTNQDEFGLYSISLEPDFNHYIEVMPLKSQGIQTVWRWGKEERSRKNLNINIKAKMKKDGTFMIVEKYRDENVMIKNVFADKKYRTENGSLQLKDIFGDKVFDYPKPVDLIKVLLQTSVNHDGLILDFYAGSGTTGQAVLELNKEDGGHRRFVLCTNNENGICEEVTYPRIKTIITGKRIDGSKYSDGLPANLYYFKTDFIKDELNTEQAKYNLVEKVDALLCISENVFNEIERNEYSSHYKDNDKHLFIYNEYFNETKFNEFKNRVLNCVGEKIVYIYSSDNYLDENLIVGNNITLKPIPSKIYEIYKEIVEDIKRGE